MPIGLETKITELGSVSDFITIYSPNPSSPQVAAIADFNPKLLTFIAKLVGEPLRKQWYYLVLLIDVSTSCPIKSISTSSAQIRSAFFYNGD